MLGDPRMVAYRDRRRNSGTGGHFVETVRRGVPRDSAGEPRAHAKRAGRQTRAARRGEPSRAEPRRAEPRPWQGRLDSSATERATARGRAARATVIVEVTTSQAAARLLETVSTMGDCALLSPTGDAIPGRFQSAAPCPRAALRDALAREARSR
jgi:hypothetical protein